MSVPFLRLVSLLVPLTLVACSSDDAGTGSSSGGGATSALQDKLAACPQASATSDGSAGNCLAGTYEGTTLGGGACKVVLRERGAYDFTSPDLTYTYEPTAKTLYTYGHTVAGDSQVLSFFANDPIATGVTHDFKLEAQWGGSVDDSLQIDVTERTDAGSTSVACKVPF